MKKALLIIGLLLTVTLVNSYNYPTKSGTKPQAYYRKTLELCMILRKDLIRQLSIVGGNQVWQQLSGIIGLIIGIVAGVIKEIYDSRHKGKFDKKDLIADIFGSISGSVLGIIFILLT